MILLIIGVLIVILFVTILKQFKKKDLSTKENKNMKEIEGKKNMTASEIREFARRFVEI